MRGKEMSVQSPRKGAWDRRWDVAGIGDAGVFGFIFAGCERRWWKPAKCCVLGFLRSLDMPFVIGRPALWSGHFRATGDIGAAKGWQRA